MAQWLRMRVAVSEDSVGFPAPTSVGSQLPVTPVPEDPVPISGPCGHCYIHGICTHGHRHINFKENCISDPFVLSSEEKTG